MRIRSWIPLVPAPRIGKRSPHLLRIPDSEELRPVGDLKIGPKVIKALEEIGIMTVQDMARLSSRQVADIAPISIELIYKFKNHCAARGIKSEMQAGQVWKIRLNRKQSELRKVHHADLSRMPKLKSRMPSRAKRKKRPSTS